MKEHRHSKFHNVPMLSFGKTILLRRVRTRDVMLDATTLKMRKQLVVYKLSTTITLKDLDSLIKLIFHQGLKTLKYKENIRFQFKRIEPTKS